MAYRRKQVTPRATTFVEDFRSPPPPAAAAAADGATEDAADVGGGGDSSSSSSNTSSLAAQAMRASAAHRHSSSLSSAYGEAGLIAYGESVLSCTPAAGNRDPNRLRRSATYNTRNTRKEGVMMVESRTADIIEETKKLHIRRKSGGSNALNVATDLSEPNSFSQNQNGHETQLKASRDVANAMAAKSKLLLREMKTVKADLAFAKERCNQLEDENRLLRESREKGDNHEDEDLIRLQLETLLEEKGRLAHENSVYARENRFLREIVEYHQLTMQDVVYVDGGIE